MRKRMLIAAILAALITVGGAFLAWNKLSQAAQPGKPSVAPTITREMKLTSVAFAGDETIPVRYTCIGVNVSPPLTISDVPAETKTLAIVVDDTFAPLGTFTHWLVWNIPPEIHEIAEARVPPTSQEGTNSAGKLGYFGPCPPARHRYDFNLFALDASISLDGKAKKADLEKAMSGHVISETTLSGFFGGK